MCRVSDCEELVGVITGDDGGLFSLGNSVELVWCSRSPWSPSASIRKGKTPSQIPKSILIDTGFGTCVENQNILKKINNIFDNKDDPFRK